MPKNKKENNEVENNEDKDVGVGDAIKVQSYLAAISYPATKQDLIDTAMDQGATEEVMDMLDEIPDIEYARPSDVSEEIGKLE